MRRLTKSRTEGDAVRACSPPQGSPQGRVPDFVKRMLDDVLFDTQLRWVEKSGQAPHWTTFVLDAGDPTVNVGSADKTPPKVECRPTFKYCRWWGLLAQLPITGTQFNSSALLNGGTSAPLLAIYCWQQLICQDAKLSNMW